MDPSEEDDLIIAEMAAFEEAMLEYIQRNHRPFPTYSEMLQVALALGYRKCSPEGVPVEPTPEYDPSPFRQERKLRNGKKRNAVSDGMPGATFGRMLRVKKQLQAALDRGEKITMSMIPVGMKGFGRVYEKMFFRFIVIAQRNETDLARQAGAGCTGRPAADDVDNSFTSDGP